MGQVHILTGIIRRRRWSVEEKRALVAEAFAPGAVLAEVARRADVACGQLYRWRKELRDSGPATAGFVPMVIQGAGPGMPAPSGLAAGDASGAMIEVTVKGGAQVRLPASVSPELAAAVLQVVTRR